MLRFESKIETCIFKKSKEDINTCKQNQFDIDTESKVDINIKSKVDGYIISKVDIELKGQVKVKG